MDYYISSIKSTKQSNREVGSVIWFLGDLTSVCAMKRPCCHSCPSYGMQRDFRLWWNALALRNLLLRTHGHFSVFMNHPIGHIGSSRRFIPKASGRIWNQSLLHWHGPQYHFLHVMRSILRDQNLQNIPWKEGLVNSALPHPPTKDWGLETQTSTLTRSFDSRLPALGSHIDTNDTQELYMAQTTLPLPYYAICRLQQICANGLEAEKCFAKVSIQKLDKKHLHVSRQISNLLVWMCMCTLLDPNLKSISDYGGWCLGKGWD